MRICGIKLTHDAAVAVIDGDDLLFSIEMEKIDNRCRHSELGCVSGVTSALRMFGVSPNDVDTFVFDGWFGGIDGTEPVDIPFLAEGIKSLRVSSYLPSGGVNSIAGSFLIERKAAAYHSYPHIFSHIVGGWATSGFAADGENCLVLVWDGGTVPRLFEIDPRQRSVKFLCSLHWLKGNVYSIFAQHYEPFLCGSNEVLDDFSIPGKLMAYVALGHRQPQIVQCLRDAYICFEAACEAKSQTSLGSAAAFSREAFRRIALLMARPVDVLASFHCFVQELLLERLKKAIDNSTHLRRLCFVGGSALNIKWNTAIRDSGLVDELWVPPITNDSGAALGAACCHRFFESDGSASRLLK